MLCKKKVISHFTYFGPLGIYLIDCHLFLLICLADVAILGSDVYSFPGPYNPSLFQLPSLKKVIF